MKLHDREFYGTTTLGEKGQVVIPAEARAKAKLVKGEKLLVFGIHNDTLIFTKASNLERFASHLEARLATLKTVLKASKKSKKK
jgi:AbrB family looped-hinge helix DNA binding protein